jgi:hypothetical protein
MTLERRHQIQAAYRARHREQLRESDRLRRRRDRISNPEKHQAASRRWYAAHGLEAARRRYAKDPERAREACRRSYVRHIEKRREDARLYQRANKGRFREVRNRYTTDRKRKDPVFKIACVLRSTLNGYLRRRGQVRPSTLSAVRSLGCSLLEFKTYIEQKFTAGMSWENHGVNGWHLDHRTPLSSVDLTDPVQLQKVIHYTNLQPMWAADNIRKRGSVPA